MRVRRQPTQPDVCGLVPVVCDRRTQTVRRTELTIELASALGRPLSGRVVDGTTDQSVILGDMSARSDRHETLDVLQREAVRWAGGGLAQPLVDAAAVALAVGHDTPTLRVLAGAPKASAEDEASELAPDMFDELGLDIHARLSNAAILDWARLHARECLAGDFSYRALAVDLYWAWVNSDYLSELDDWGSLEERYVMLDEGVLAGSYEEADEAVREAAAKLLAG